MALLHSKSAEQQVSQLCVQLETCRSVDDVQRALNELDVSVVSGGSAEAVLYQLQAPTQAGGLTELVLASGCWAQPLSDWLLGTFPTTIDQYLPSIHRVVVEKLSLFLTFLPYSFTREEAHLLRQHRASVEKAPQVISGLMTSSFEEPRISPTLPVELEESELGGFAIGKKMKQSERKQARKAKRQAGPFKRQGLHSLGVEEPRSSLEAHTAAQLLLDGMRKAFQEYLSLLRCPDITSITHMLFVVEAPSADMSHTGGDRTENPNDATTHQGDQPVPSAYPYVQPMKAALYFENAKGFGEWRIVISTRADRSLRDARRRDRHNFEIYIKKIKELSNGHFSADNQKRLNGTDMEVPVYEAKMTGDTRLVYQIDCVPEYDSDTERQVIRIFGVYTHAQIGKRLWSSMGYQLARKGKEYRRRCIARKRVQAGDNVFRPESFPSHQKDEKDAAIIPELPKEDLEEIHTLLVLEKFVTLSKELWISILADLDVAHVFDVTPQEMEIIEHPNSCYVLGRSGTGKTTTMLFKMLGIERAYAQQSTTSSDVTKPRQLFVTQSRVLATRVEEYFSKLLESLAAAKKTNKEIKDLAKKKRLLRGDAPGLYDVDDDVTWKASLPQQFSLLQDEHFPLFLTFEKLAQLLEGDIEPLQPKEPSGGKFNTTSKGRFVNYDVFFEKYWPHFPQNLTKNLNPALVFSELLGVIEGSEESLSHKPRYLDQTSYRNLSHRAQHVFASQRDRIYDLFIAYTRHKREHGHFDTAERTHRILNALEGTDVLGKKVDFLYVDEAQDNLLIDAMLLRSLCRNPNGLFWAGDTAQTIAIGSSFRFNDLKAFLYRLELRREENLNMGGGIAQTELRTFQLVTNYRSHGGIVRCASAVIDLITHFWPYAIDSLAPEQGLVDGAKPVFFSGWDTNTVRYEQFLSEDSGKAIEFGARQCILVRDEAGRAEVRQWVGDGALIFTLYESKGLEFDDVLLYKFFENSKVELSQWRVILNLLDPSQCPRIAAPRFDESRHAAVCAELKFLYVAITRSRKNLWIVDCSDKAEPMKMLWESKGFIQTCKPGGKVPRLAASSSREEWASTARDLFANRRYLQAEHAFKRAAMEREATIAHTHHLREAARLVPPTTKDRPRVRREAFRSAALSFLKCARGATVKEARVYFHNAGECFEQAGDCGDFFEDYRCAAKAYKEALEYNSAVKLYRKGDMFDEAVEVVQKHRREIDFDLAESVLEVARLFYFRRKDYKKAKSLFDSVQEQLEYFENNILLDECHADVLVELARYQEAADIHIEEGRTMKAIQVLLSDKSQESIRRANDHILQGLWQNTSFSMKIKDSDTAAVEFLSLASKVNYDFLSSTQKDEVAMFRNLRTTANDGIYFRDIAYEFLKRGEKPQALLCLDHFFVNLSFASLANSPSSDIWPLLENFLDYCRLFRETVTSLDLADEGSQKLFNFHPASVENAYHVPADTWLHRQINSATRKTGILEVDDAGIVVASADLFQALRTSLLRRLSERLSDQNSHCRRLQLWTPCLPHVVNGTCYRSGCPRQHLHKKELTQGWFNDQLRGVFLQIMVYQIYHSLPLEKEPERLFPDSRRYWIHKLHEAMRPPTHYMGSEACLRLEDIRAHAEPALAIVKSWCLDILHTRDIGRDRMVLSFLYEAAALCLMFDRSRAIQYLPQAPLLGTFTELACYYRPIAATGDKAYIVPELYQCLQAADVNFITAGTLFLHHVVSQRITIDLNLLSHLYEFLAGSSVLARRKFGLHMVTLPRGWFVLLLQHTKVQEASTILLDRLLHSLAQLLRDLVYGGDGGRYLLFEGRDLAELPAIRDLFILRVCRALGLIGYNINHDDLRREVVDALKVLNSAKPHHSFKRFIGRHSWGGVALAVQSSYAESQLDDLVELYSMDGVGPLKPPPAGVRRVFFESSEHALVVLGKGPMRAEAPEFVPKAKVEAGAPSVANRGETDEPADQAFEQPETDSTELVDSRNLVESLISTAAPLAPESITDEQKAIASTLLAGYRRIVRTRKMEKAKTQTQKSCDSFYLTCLKLSQGIDWGDVTFYKKLYLGLVPHLLTCVDVVQPYAQSAKKKLRPRLLDESERNLEGLKKEMNDLSAVLKSSANIRKQLDPSSSFHKERNVEKLKLLVGEVQELLDRVPSGHGLDVKLHLDIAIKGIVTEKKVPKPSPKPELNVDDLDDIYY